MNLARWIRRHPVPYALMCDDRRIIIGDGRRRWADAVDAVFSCTSDTIAGVAKDGSVLRICNRADVDDAPSQEAPDAEVTDKQKELAQVAQIIADAYSCAHDHARENGAKGYELLAKITELAFGRLAQIEKAYAALLAAHANAMTSEPQNDGLDSAIATMVGKSFGSGGNGKKETTP